ncbi:pilus assembly protein [Streptomonospora sp. S1-112]|uniref:Pilus assembly protein n=1 Tax=Streptomonospora mangrovi TaxID=2883123 RepID=A0A9X3NJX0_9ACTN|nr:TadE/TadG family type IV pilus assembly protein [Streptomonospora mangrovi]MDA0565174.1 pilus assembly protein [Streptomonospora mangrovi]
MRRPHPTRRDDRGSTELAVAAPLLLLLVMLVVQAALWGHAHHTAQAITHHALAAARTAQATGADGQAAAEQAADQFAGQVLTDLSITVERTPETARVTLSAQVPSLVPGLSWPVHQQRSAPVERTTPAEEGT